MFYLFGFFFLAFTEEIERKENNTFFNDKFLNGIVIFAIIFETLLEVLKGSCNQLPI